MRTRLKGVLLISVVLASCGGEPVPDVARAQVVALAPHADFASSGKVDFALLPEDATGAAIVTLDLLVQVQAGAPAGVIPMLLDIRTEAEASASSQLGSVVITVAYSPVPEPGTAVRGRLLLGNGAQRPLPLDFNFVVPHPSPAPPPPIAPTL